MLRPAKRNRGTTLELNRRLQRFVIIALLLLIAGGAMFAWARRPVQERQIKLAAFTPSQTIEASGEILGIAIGSAIQAAQKKFDPLRVPTDYTPDAKEISGRRILWRLRETEYEWIMTWAGGDGRITRVRALFRPENAKPFAEIGDLQRAAAVSANMAKWNLRLPGGPNFRLVAQGAERRAQSVYMFALQFPGEPLEGAVPDAEEAD